MSEKNSNDPTTKKKSLKLTKEVIKELKDEELEKVAGGDDQGGDPEPIPPEGRPPWGYEEMV